MTWASRPTAPMPVPSFGRHRRRRPGRLHLIGALVLLAVVVIAVGPSLLGGSGPGRAHAPAAKPTTDALPRPSSTLPSVTVSSTLFSPEPTATPTGTSPTEASSGPAVLSPLEAEVLALTNAERAKHDCDGLRLDTKLLTAARRHSAEMARYQNMTHTGLDGSSPGDRMTAAGYDTRQGWAENVASGFRTAQSVMNGWMSSDGHRANILNCRYRSIGIGAARAGDGKLYWTQDFGGR